MERRVKVVNKFHCNQREDKHLLDSFSSLRGTYFFPSSDPLPTKMPSFSFSDKIAHFIQFGILASLIYLALRDINTTKNKLFALAFIIAFLYGVSLEIHQYFIPGRSADILDVMAYGIGAFCFLLIMTTLRRQETEYSSQNKYINNSTQTVHRDSEL